MAKCCIERHRIDKLCNGKFCNLELSLSFSQALGNQMEILTRFFFIFSLVWEELVIMEYNGKCEELEKNSKVLEMKHSIQFKTFPSNSI